MERFKTLIEKSHQFNRTVYNNSWQWRLLEELYEKNYADTGGSRVYCQIPERIHQIWLGGPLPDKYKTWCNSWKEFHPSWEYQLWTDEDVDSLNLPNRYLYDSISNYGAKSDILRYHILNEFGGIYVDTDFECLKDFHTLSYLNFFTGVGYPAEVELYVGIIGSIPHHPVMEEVVADIDNFVSNEKINTDILNATSSYMFTRSFFRAINKYQKEIVVFPPDYLYPFPNKKDIRIEDAKSYIKDCSYAIHYWEVSWAVANRGRDWIMGDRFKELADMTYSPAIRSRDDYDKLPNTFNPSFVKENEITFVYTHTFYAKQLFDVLRHLRGRFVVVTHNGDDSVNFVSDLPENVVRWYAQNVNVVNPRIESIPIGLQNNRWDKISYKKIRMVEQLKRPKKYINLVYMNHDVKTNQDERAELYRMFENKSWVTAVRGRNGFKFEEYLDNIYNHKFVICPEGNGIDTHRVWECLYMSTIPIQRQNINNQFYIDLPICFVDDWSELTEEFLNAEWEQIKKGKWNLAKLNFEYWKNRIRSTNV